MVQSKLWVLVTVLWFDFVIVIEQCHTSSSSHFRIVFYHDECMFCLHQDHLSLAVQYFVFLRGCNSLRFLLICMTYIFIASMFSSIPSLICCYFCILFPVVQSLTLHRNSFHKLVFCFVYFFCVVPVIHYHILAWPLFLNFKLMFSCCGF